MARRALVSGGAGFIGSNLVKFLLAHGVSVCNVDALTYAANLDSLADLGAGDYTFVLADIRDRDAMRELLEQFDPDLVFHLAAESHVDRSIEGPAVFVTTNVLGTFTLLDVARELWTANGRAVDSRRFVHVSTDEVYGSLGDDGLFTETTRYDPSSPYAASKAGADHLAHAYFRTYGLPVIVTNCSNNYGPRQFPEKLIPLMITRALSGEPMPVYGAGNNVRDWLYVDDHCEALWAAAERGTPGRDYNIGGNQERRNIDVVRAICAEVERARPARTNEALAGKQYEELITFVDDRPGHDFRYAIDASRIARELSWEPSETFESGLEKTVRWYLENARWVERATSGEYRDWIDKNYAERLEARDAR
ncbi:MAG: dTDP-glucose 4,6-dehydratase [Myxococcales bacterium]|nr:dTDP-glucose 4,6-dehydratase [Myxococcales bacterium]